MSRKSTPALPESGHLFIELMGHEGPGLWFASPQVLNLVGSFLGGADPSDTALSAPAIDWATGDGR